MHKVKYFNYAQVPLVHWRQNVIPTNLCHSPFASANVCGHKVLNGNGKGKGKATSCETSKTSMDDIILRPHGDPTAHCHIQMQIHSATR